uniref:WD_REPEATS_REGION domain-containing protein n=1 Tax=Plectus sambesii TaxID=2011161 RepID=A0A914XKC3_9BILA
VAVYLSLFTYAFAAYDSRWLFRLTAHHLDTRMFATVFGGGGEKLLSSKSAPPPRPKPPRPKSPAARDSSPLSIDRLTTAIDSSSIRSKLNAKLFGPGSPALPNGAPASNIGSMVEQTVLRWVPPKKSLVSFFSSKPLTNVRDELGVEYDSEDAVSEAAESDDEQLDENELAPQHSDPSSYAWAILRLALVKQLIFRLQQFLSLCGQESCDLAANAPRIDAIMKVLALWEISLAEDVRNVPGGCPPGFLPRSTVDVTATSGPSLHKYRTIIEPGNTPFETDDPTALPVRRLWAYLVRQEHLMEIFIRYIFSRKQPDKIESRNDQTAGVFGSALPEAYKIVQREQDPLVAFALSQTNRGWLVVSTGRELQEMDISSILDGNKLDWLYDTTELDIALSEMKKDPLKDNDDYQLLMEKDRKESAASFMTAFIVDRSRKALPKLLKRQVSGIRRIDAHPSLPYYVSGASDGSVRLWEWGIGQPLYTPRPASQYAKVTKVTFSANGNKFAAVDGDGLLCLWQVSHGMPIRKPFFNQKCHSKSAADVRFLGSASSLLVTAGYGSGEQNLALWDTLLPNNKAIIQTWSCHPEGASCVMYLPQQQTLISGGRHGEMCFWDLRMRQLRSSIKAFDNATVKTLVGDPNNEFFIAGSSDGDIKIWSQDATPQLVYALSGEHAARGGFSLRQVGGGNVQGVQQVFVDDQQRVFSCGADCSLKLRALPSILHSI